MLKNTQKEFDKVWNKLDELVKKNKELQISISVLNDERIKLKKDIADLEIRVDRLMTSNKEMSDKLSKLESSVPSKKETKKQTNVAT